MTKEQNFLNTEIAKGSRTRNEILEMAVQIASVEGLEGISLGRLANEVGMSKSGLFAHFRSKRDLQLAVVETARSMFIKEIIEPAQGAPSGVKRLRKLAESWLSYAERNVFQGGCFFLAASLEFDSRPGPLRDRITEIMGEWLRLLENEIRQARANEELVEKADPAQLAFEINSQMMGANWAFQLLGIRKAFARAKTAIVERLDGFAASAVRRRPGSHTSAAPHRATTR